MSLPAPPMKQVDWLCVTCHDLACNCKAPFTMKKYSFGHTPKIHQRQINYQKAYVVPGRCITPATSTDSLNTAGTNTDYQSDSMHYVAAPMNRPQPISRSKSQIDVSALPLGVGIKRPFMVSTPHMLSAGHMEHWPGLSRGINCRGWAPQTGRSRATSVLANPRKIRRQQNTMSSIRGSLKISQTVTL